VADNKNDDYPHPTFRVEAICEIVESCGSFHSRQSEATLHRALGPLPKYILEFVKHRVRFIWKKKNHVAVLLASDSQKAYAIVLDTKLENVSMEVRVGILGLKIAEAYLLEEPSLKVTREELATRWGVDVTVLKNEAIQGLTF